MGVKKYSGIFARRRRGFTLIEIVVVVAVIGILAAISGSNFIRMQRNAKMAACISHQRGVLEAAVAYAVENSVPDGDMNVDVLQAAGFVAMEICECPSSPVEDFDDYLITWENNFPKDIRCTYRGAEHEYEP
jgi:prepilin-type N-terminal cleavage/methylation domain-containing protein